MDVNLNNNLPQPDPRALEQSEALIQLIREEIIQEGDYERMDALAATRRIESLIDGLWLNILLYPESTQRSAARDDVFDLLALLFPKHSAAFSSGQRLCRSMPDARRSRNPFP